MPQPLQVTSCASSAVVSTAADAKQYGNIENDFIYQQLLKPGKDRAISQQILLRPEAIEVWQEFAASKTRAD